MNDSKALSTIMPTFEMKGPYGRATTLEEKLAALRSIGEVMVCSEHDRGGGWRVHLKMHVSISHLEIKLRSEYNQPTVEICCDQLAAKAQEVLLK